MEIDGKKVNGVPVRDMQVMFGLSQLHLNDKNPRTWQFTIKYWVTGDNATKYSTGTGYEGFGLAVAGAQGKWEELTNE